ncbi:MAG TPA: DUF4097 family beta strand repeat-containing protein [Gracilimonas sp.]|uniref:DUF4097 family beta strand repeat-containing protein n=1 Tax=Gracilimonas sp. TaxID=1974203 RepID=UPI002D861A57|nr:DUF4097 family beta strand repeat-containing protein [Gracilimonas sp.]
MLLIIIWVLGHSVEAQTPVVSQRTNENVEMRIPASEFNDETIFHLKNINGDLNAVGYDGDEILITGTKIVTGNPATRDNFNPEEIYLDRLRGTNSIFVFVQHPGVEVEVRGDELHYTSNRKNKRSWNENSLEFEFNLQLKIPHYLMSHISTINGGEVVVEGMSNGINAANINGSVFVNNVAGPVKAQTVNGNIRVEYEETPSGTADFHTVNGTIEVIAPKDLSAVVTFKSLHGELYTDFEQIEYLQNRVKRNSDGNHRLKIERSSPIQFGEGGPEMRLQLLNGNAYIKQRKS